MKNNTEQKDIFAPRKCLNHGFVRLVDYMGDDDAIVQAARTSYGKGTKTINEDRSLIRYLMRNRHTSPFEMVELKFHIKLPIFIARQWIRHRTANVNEYSGRYSEMPDEFYVPESNDIRKQSTHNKQGRAEELFDTAESAQFVDNFAKEQASVFNNYKTMIDAGMAREMARINLPLSIYTEWYWKIDLHNLFHFLRLRLDEHAQYEIRVYGEAIAEIIREIVPLAYEAFEDYILNSIMLSKLEQNALAKMLGNKELKIEDLADSGLSKREQAEFLCKIAKMQE